jgi:hypothetical protein
MQRRRFLFWVSLGVFQAGQALRIDALDRLAAAMINTCDDRSVRGAPHGVAIAEPQPDADDAEDDGPPGQPHPKRRARHGRPPSRWLRSLNAEELRVWLKTVDPPEAGVSGMTFWTHLTRDHSFLPEKIEGLNEADQAKLHAAAHDGY